MKLHYPLKVSTIIGLSHIIVGIAMIVVSAISVYFIYKNGEQTSMREMESLVVTLSHQLESIIERAPQGDAQHTEVQTALRQALELRSNVRYNILTKDGVVDPTYVQEPIGVSSPHNSEVLLAITHSIGQAIHPDHQGRLTIYAAAPIDEQQERYGILVLAVPHDEMMAPTYATMRWSVGFMLILLALLAIEAWISSRYISQSLAQLNQTAVKLSQGQLNTRAIVKGPIEVENLARALNEMASRLEASLESLRAFVSNASHELRTPLTSIKLQVGALRGGALEEPVVAQRFLGQIESEIDRLVRMVNDMLDLSNIEGGFPSGHSDEPVCLEDLAKEVLAFWEARSRQAGLTLSLFADPALPMLKGDTYQLRRLLDNLVDNAINNTPSGGQVSIHVRRCPDEQHVRIEVKDTGQGIPAEHIPYLFNRFYRITAPNKGGHHEGSGLGLAIARSIVVSHGGVIGVNSLPGSGSTFWVELPVL